MGAAAAGGVTAATQILGAKMQADAIEEQSAWQAQQLEFNRETTAMQRREIMKKSQEDTVLRQRDVSAMLGIQKATLAASNIDLGSDLAKTIEADTRKAGRDDVQAIQNNAWREAWGLDVRVADLNNQRNFALAGGQLNAATTYATGGLQGMSSVASGWAQQMRDNRR